MKYSTASETQVSLFDLEKVEKRALSLTCYFLWQLIKQKIVERETCFKWHLSNLGTLLDLTLECLLSS